ncbi:YpjP family protein [Saliterribacillus persicus]|uniref:YpjP-like protein n=1 Tax=Saliterribacillus persicus TaxID=930114 RepID=A0A368XZ71_9BACI|nr:YpjP family protein [Saliterribacillus persicus]RCW73165.1 YpjP-like protein [Saliterribacillus persicus]
MKRWLKKFTVVFITILTLGLYVPPIYLDAEVDEGDVAPSNENDLKTDSPENSSLYEQIQHEEIDTASLYLDTLTQKAIDQTYQKLGVKIGNEVKKDFTNEIVPNIETVLNYYYEEAGKVESQFFSITAEPSAGYGERIFHLHDQLTKMDIARFHVNRIKRPQDGYYFQFHYHVKEDGFEEHLPIGEIYWGKNMPPKWMA